MEIYHHRSMEDSLHAIEECTALEQKLALVVPDPSDLVLLQQRNARNTPC